jgi:hypothetical protein
MAFADRKSAVFLLPALLVTVAAVPACATSPEPLGGGDNLPNAVGGPFRVITADEIGNNRSAPDALEDTNNYARDPSVIDADGDPTTPGVVGYFGAVIAYGDGMAKPTDPTNVIVRYGALDGRSFDSSAEKVLDAETYWEGGVLSAPSAVRVGAQIYLYVGSTAAIGLSTSPDGHTFSRLPDPVFIPDPDLRGWEKGAAPRSPGVVRLDDGSFRMFYQVALGSTPEPTAIGEASSPDGIVWTRVGSAPALAPSGSGASAGAAATDAGVTDAGADDPYDSVSVGSPFPMLATTAEGRRVLRVYYGAIDHSGTRTIGLAARYGDDGPLERGASPVYGSGSTLGPTEPCVLPWGGGFALLYATQRASLTADHEAVVVGVAPAQMTLPTPNPR